MTLYRTKPKIRLIMQSQCTIMPTCLLVRARTNCRERGKLQYLRTSVRYICMGCKRLYCEKESNPSVLCGRESTTSSQDFIPANIMKFISHLLVVGHDDIQTMVQIGIKINYFLPLVMRPALFKQCLKYSLVIWCGFQLQAKNKKLCVYVLSKTN